MSEQELKNLQGKLQPILVKFRVRHADVVGSVARGEDTPTSDLDLVVELDDEATLFDLVRLRQALEQKLGHDVDLMTQNSIHPRLKDAILRDRVSIL